jgi:hypothetical protein
MENCVDVDKHYLFFLWITMDPHWHGWQPMKTSKYSVTLKAPDSTVDLSTYIYDWSSQYKCCTCVDWLWYCRNATFCIQRCTCVDWLWYCRNATFCALVLCISSPWGKPRGAPLLQTMLDVPITQSRESGAGRATHSLTAESGPCCSSTVGAANSPATWSLPDSSKRTPKGRNHEYRDATALRTHTTPGHVLLRLEGRLDADGLSLLTKWGDTGSRWGHSGDNQH